MLLFRTILLWMAFILLIVIELPFTGNLDIGFFRLLPSLILVLWFVSYFFKKQRYAVRRDADRRIVSALGYLRPLANISVIAGAVMRLSRVPYSNIPLIAGIGLLALVSSLWMKVSLERPEYDPEIIDDSSEEIKGE
jgi:hypothetical protein